VSRLARIAVPALLLALLPDAHAAPTKPFATKRIYLQSGAHHGLYPTNATYDSKRGCYYISSADDGTEILRYDPRTGAVSQVFRFQGGVSDLHYDATTDRLFIASSYLDAYVLDPGRKFRVVHKWRAGGRPDRIAFDPRTKQLFVSNGGYGGRDGVSRAIMVFRLGKRRAVKIIKLKFAPKHLALDPKTRRLYIASYNRSIGRMYGYKRRGPAGVLAILDTRRLRIIKRRTLPINPYYMVYDSKQRRLIFKPRWGHGRLLQLPTFGGKLTRVALAPLRQGYELYNGYYDARDHTVRWLLRRKRDHLVVKLAFQQSTGTYQLRSQRALPGLSPRWALPHPGPNASQVLLTVPMRRTVALVDLKGGGLKLTRTGYRIEQLAVNNKLGLVYALDGRAGALVLLNANTGKVLRRLAVPQSSQRLIVSERLGLLAFLADTKLPGWRRGAKTGKTLFVYDARLKRRRLSVRFQTTISRYTRVVHHAVDAKRKMIYLVCDQHVEAISLTTGTRRRFKPPFRDARGVLVDERRNQLLIAGRVRQLALYDARTLRLRKQTTIDHKLCRGPVSARRLGRFDTCRAVFELWPNHSVWRFHRALSPVKYPDNYFLDRRGKQVVIIDRPSGRWTADFYGIGLRRYAQRWKKTLRLRITLGKARGKRDGFDRKTRWFFDPRNRVVLQLGRGQTKYRSTPKDFRKHLNYVYSFRPDDPRSRLTLASRAVLRWNPRTLVLAPRLRHAFVSHLHASYLTLLKY